MLKNFSKSVLKMKIISLIIFMITISSFSFGQVTITKPSLTVTAYCSFPTSYYNLGNIVITESQTNNFSMLASTTYTLTLTAPTNFEFNPGVGGGTIASGDIGSATIAVTASTITITYTSTTGNVTNDTDQITISGIQVRGTNTASSGIVYRALTGGGTGSIVGLTLPTTSLADLTSNTSAASPAITTNPSNSTITAGSNTSFTVAASNNPSSYTWEVSTNGGGSWTTVTNGGVYTTATTATLNITAAPPSMNGYMYRARATNGCGTSANSTTATLTVNYCIPTISTTYQPPTNHHIRKVEFIGTLLDITNTSTYSASAPYGYQDFTGLATKSQQAQGEGVNIYFESPNSGFMKAWVDWNKDGDFADAGETVYDAGGTSQASTTLGFIIPGATPVGDYRVRLRISGKNISGTDAGSSWDSCSTNLAYYGETEDYLFTVVASCAAKITAVTNGSVCGPGTVTLGATGSSGTTEYRWYGTETGGSQLVGSPTATGSWTTPSISSTTDYWVTAYNGSCESLVRTKVTATVKPVAALSFITASPQVCGEDDKIQLTATGSSEVVSLIDETFEAGSLGTFTASTSVTPASAPVSSASAWQNKTSPYIPTGTTWFPAISSGINSNKFAFVSSDVGTCGAGCYYTIDNSLVSATVNSTSFTSLTLEFKLFYDRYYVDTTNSTAEYMSVDVSTNGGGSWTSVSGSIISDQGYGTKFKQMSYNLNAYINQANLKIRIRYYTSTWANGGAVDEILLYGSKPLSPNFTWTGSPVAAFTDAACTIPYTAGTTLASPDIWIKPTLTQLETSSYSFTANANLTNGCTTSATINVTNKTKVWKGTTNNDWNNTNNWLPLGVPTANDCVIISTGTTSQIMNTPNALAKNLKVKGTGNLELQSGRNLTVTDWINVEGGATFNIRNSANLVQVTPTPSPANSGNINMERTAYIDFRDYVYWSSPVANFNSANISTYSNNANLYKWIPTTGAVNGFGNWTSGVETMVLGAGYIERGLNNAPLNSPVNFTSTFTGIPNNGSITTPISRGTYSGVNYATGVSTTPATDDDDNWNLLGNPYPSAISAADFLNANSTNLDGFVKIWTHGIAPSTSASDPFYNNYGYNYDPNDYITWNLSGPSTPGFSGFIGAGQGFITKMKHTSPTTSSTAVFNNTMRNETHTNSEFYKAANNERAAIGNNEGHIWIDLVSSSASTRSLIAYVNGATNDKDQMYDAQSDMKSNFRINSLLGPERFIIQGRTTPFNANDQVNLAVSTPTNGTYQIAIGAIDGIFTNQSQNIYLQDKQLNIIHDLRSAPYQFTTVEGENIDRFILRYTKNQNLNNNVFDNNNSVSIYSNENINIKSSLVNIREIKVYDVLGKTLLSKNKVSKNEIILTELKPTSSLVIVKVILDNENEITQKVIF